MIQLTSNRKFLNHSWFLFSPFVLSNYSLAVFINNSYSFLSSVPDCALTQGSTHLSKTLNLPDNLKLWSVSVSWVLGSQAYTQSPSSCSAGDQTQSFKHMIQAPYQLSKVPSLSSLGCSMVSCSFWPEISLLSIASLQCLQSFFIVC